MVLTSDVSATDTGFDEELLEDGCFECGGELMCPNCSPESMTAINNDIRKLARDATAKEARFLVDNYYMAQKNRIRAGNQINQTKKEGEPYDLLQVNFKNFKFAENQIFKVLDEYSANQPLGQWARSIHGIGPVITAGLLAHIDLNIAKTPAGIWRFAGLDPTVTWDKNEKRPWNSQLKTLCFKVASSFEKVQNSDKDFYGHMMAKRKLYEIANNDAGKYAETAKKTLATGSYKKDTSAKKAYEQGRLPDGQIRMRALRWSVKLFLSHYWHVGYEIKNNMAPPKPWVIAIGGHQDFIAPPNWENGQIVEN